MKTVRWCAIALIALFSLSTLRAQVAVPSPARGGEIRESVFGVGISAGFASGIGLSFKHHLPGRLAYVVNGGVIKSKDRVSYAVGGELQFDLQRSPETRFFAVGGGGYYYSGTDAVNEMEAPGRIGIGIGGELPLAAGLGISAQLLFTYLSDGTILPLPQGAIHYYFH